MIIVGIDPDAHEHGVAIYRDGKLSELLKWTLPKAIEWIHKTDEEMKFSIENVMANQFVYARNRKSSKSVESKIAMHIGRCQQSQVELMRILEYLSVPYELHKPQKGNWANNKDQFQRVTGWTKQSNQDTRSAAYFGYLAIR